MSVLRIPIVLTLAALLTGSAAAQTANSSAGAGSASQSSSGGTGGTANGQSAGQAPSASGGTAGSGASKIGPPTAVEQQEQQKSDADTKICKGC